MAGWPARQYLGRLAACDAPLDRRRRAPARSRHSVIAGRRGLRGRACLHRREFGNAELRSAPILRKMRLRGLCHAGKLPSRAFEVLPSQAADAFSAGAGEVGPRFLVWAGGRSRPRAPSRDLVQEHRGIRCGVAPGISRRLRSGGGGRTAARGKARPRERWRSCYCSIRCRAISFAARRASTRRTRRPAPLPIARSNAASTRWSRRSGAGSSTCPSTTAKTSPTSAARVALFATVPRDRERRGSWGRYGRPYIEVIERFGRFPHRNEILGRQSTAEELAFLAARKSPSSQSSA